jgi:hypothetical protein
MISSVFLCCPEIAYIPTGKKRGGEREKKGGKRREKRKKEEEIKK